jgi:uncharacterized damage-inducible protein DinB
MMAMSQRRWLHDLYRHQEWADAEHWRMLTSHAAARDDQTVRTRLHHIHLVEHAFLWMVGDRTIPPRITTLEDFPSLDTLRAYARGYYSQMDAIFSSVTDERLAAAITIPWFQDPPLSITVADALTQCVMHSQHHRGQNAVRLRELGGQPSDTDYIIWLWKGRPAAAW